MVSPYPLSCQHPEIRGTTQRLESHRAERWDRDITEYSMLNSAIFLISKAISEEALEMLYSNSTFALLPRIPNNGPIDDTLGTLGWSMVRRVQISINVGDWYDGIPPWTEGHVIHERFQDLVEECVTMISYPHRSLRLRLKVRPYASHPLYYGEELLEPLKRMGSFKIIRIDLERNICKGRCWHCCRCRLDFWKPSSRCLGPSYLKWASRVFKTALEYHLGPALRCQDGMTHCLEFHPQNRDVWKVCMSPERRMATALIEYKEVEACN